MVTKEVTKEDEEIPKDATKDKAGKPKDTKTGSTKTVVKKAPLKKMLKMQNYMIKKERRPLQKPSESRRTPSQRRRTKDPVQNNTQKKRTKRKGSSHS